MTVKGLQLILVVFVGVLAVGTVPDIDVERPAGGNYGNSSNTKPLVKSKQILYKMLQFVGYFFKSGRIINTQGVQPPGGYTKSVQRGLQALFAAVVTFESAN